MTLSRQFSTLAIVTKKSGFSKIRPICKVPYKLIIFLTLFSNNDHGHLTFPRTRTLRFMIFMYEL